MTTLRYIRVIQSGLSTRLLNHYYTRCTELETENSWEGNDREKRWFWKTVGAVVTSGGRLFQTHHISSSTSVCGAMRSHECRLHQGQGQQVTGTVLTPYDKTHCNETRSRREMDPHLGPRHPLLPPDKIKELFNRVSGIIELHPT